MSIDSSKIVLTGGDGRLGSELRSLFPDIVCPRWPDELEITERASVERVLERYQPEMVVHAAAYTDVASAERERAMCWNTNVTGTRHLTHAVATRGIFLVHISTDYVFEGTRGMYREDDTLGPPRNYYALTKLVAEALVRYAPRHLVIRTSFRPRVWPYDTAFTDVLTSQDYVDVIAADIALAIRHYHDIPFDTLHIATERKSVYELARRRKPDVHPASKRDAGVELPDDISLDVSRWQALSGPWRART